MEAEYRHSIGVRGKPTRRVRFVSMLVWLCTAASAGLIGYFLFIVSDFGHGSSAPAPSQTQAVAPAPQTDRAVASVATISGFDENDQPFQINAEETSQDSGEDHIFHMKSVTAQLNRQTGGRIDLSANQARYDSKAKILQLSGNVRIGLDDTYLTNMPSATVAVSDKALSTDQPVTAQFENGSINAGGMRIAKDGNVITFTNRVLSEFFVNTENKDEIP